MGNGMKDIPVFINWSDDKNKAYDPSGSPIIQIKKEQGLRPFKCENCGSNEIKNNRCVYCNTAYIKL